MSEKKRSRTVTYRPPFKASGRCVIDALGYEVVHFLANEKILVSKTKAIDASLAVAGALNSFMSIDMAESEASK